MKNQYQNYLNDIHLVRSNQNLIVHNNGNSHNVKSKAGNDAYNKSKHSYIVDWQIPKDQIQKML
jgi:hypothetical protein